MLFFDWVTIIFIVLQGQNSFCIGDWTLNGFADPQSSMEAFLNMYDVIKILFFDWALQVYSVV